MATHFDYDCGNGIMWRIPLEDEKIEKRKIRVRRPDLSEAQEAVQIMRDFYAAKGIPVPQWEEEFGQKMIEAEGAPPPPQPPSSESEKEEDEAIPPMPAYGTQEFFVWCRKTKKAREAIKAKKEAAKEAAKEEKEAAKAAKEAAKLAAKEAKTKKVAEPKPKMKPRIKVKDTPV
jgi:hypothetical protein